MSCTRDKCPGLGRFTPVLVLRTSRGAPPLRATLTDLLQCEGHKNTSTLDDFLSPEGWDRMEKFLRENGKGRFSRQLTALTWDETLPF